MATPMTTTRTNYFKVTDKEKFMDIMGRVYPVEGEIEIWQKENDSKQVAFGCYDSIIGFMKEIPPKAPDLEPEREIYEESYNDFTKALQSVIEDGDACIIMSAGHCKLQSVYADATIITSKEIEIVSLHEMVKDTACDMLKNREYDPQFDY